MRKAIFAALLLSLSIPAIAQETEEQIIPETRVQPVVRQHELGIVTEGAGYENGVNFIGAQYKNWKDEHRALRFMAGMGNYYTFNSSILSLGADSVTRAHSMTKVNMPMIGAGIEMQRHFWKKVHLFAAVDLKGGYGTGTIDTFIDRSARSQYAGPTNTYGTSFVPQDVKMTYVALTPSIGAKILTGRVSIGLELMPLQFAYRNMSYEKGPSSGVLDFNGGNFQQRVSVGYRF